MTAKCFDCGLPYDDPSWVEAVVYDHIWNKYLSPTENEGGILCVNCMAKRAVRAGLSNVYVRLTAGPFVTGKTVVTRTEPGPATYARKSTPHQDSSREEHRG